MLATAGCSLSSLAESRSMKLISDRPLVGALRWDAWYAPGTKVTDAVTDTLSPEKFRWRAPFFAGAGEKKSPTMPAVTAELIAKEIELARFAGLDYWAFVAFGNEDPMSQPLHLYLNQVKKGDPKFCMFTSLDRWGGGKLLSPLVQEHIPLFAHPFYNKTSDGRPIYFIGFASEAVIVKRWGGYDQLLSTMAEFRSKSIAASGSEPYIVVSGAQNELKDIASRLKCDAISSYAIIPPKPTGSFADLANYAEKTWSMMAETNIPVVPTVMTGWDRRPRVEQPVPWERPPRPGTGLNDYYSQPTPKEIEQHLSNAIQWMNQMPKDRRSPAVLIYAWNENDEGGWLIPTAHCNTERITAIRQILVNNRGRSKADCNIHMKD